MDGYLLWGKPITAWLGILLLVLLIFQVLSGKHMIKVPAGFHRWTAIIIVLVAVVDVFLGLGIW